MAVELVNQSGEYEKDTIEMPAPTAWPIALAFGITLLFAGLVTSETVSLLGAVVAVAGAVGWFRNVLPYEAHEVLPVVTAVSEVTTTRREVVRMAVDHELRRAFLPLEIYPVSAGVKGGAIALHALVICSVLYNNIWIGYKNVKEYSTSYFKEAPLRGIWITDSFTADGSQRAAIADTERWSQLAIQVSRRLYIRDAGGQRAGFNTTYDESKHTLKLSSTQLKQSGDFTYSRPDAQHLVLRGSLNGNPLVAEFHRFDDSGLVLISRGFHWINEDPLNR